MSDSDKWELYQMGMPGEGTQWGIEFRPGYVAFMEKAEAEEIWPEDA